jgi:hypothetical protein
MLLRANFRDHSNLSTGLASQHLNIAPHQSDFMIFNANGVLFAIKFFYPVQANNFFIDTRALRQHAANSTLFLLYVLYKFRIWRPVLSASVRATRFLQNYWETRPKRRFLEEGKYELTDGIYFENVQTR